VEDDDNNDVPKAAAGSWKPQLHYVWDAILDELLPIGSPDDSKRPFPEFFRIVVDGQYVLQTPCNVLDLQMCRVLILFYVFSGAQVLGVPGVPKGTTPRDGGNHAHAVYQKLYEDLDKPSLEAG
jgi:hypothetical protein